MTEDISRASLLASDGWRPLSEYAGREYVCVRGFGFDLWNPGLGIARRGRHVLSDWWDPAGNLLRLDVREWKPEALQRISDSKDNKNWRKPELIYEAQRALESDCK
jgi:hypothetical protein